jgi:hypothetical protein
MRVTWGCPQAAVKSGGEEGEDWDDAEEMIPSLLDLQAMKVPGLKVCACMPTRRRSARAILALTKTTVLSCTWGASRAPGSAGWHHGLVHARARALMAAFLYLSLSSSGEGSVGMLDSHASLHMHAVQHAARALSHA